MTSSEDKLDFLIDKVTELHADLRVHLAVDEGMWRRVESNEVEIKALMQDSGRTRTKQAALAATISTILSTRVFTVGKLFV